jgi:hypothetical protein
VLPEFGNRRTSEHIQKEAIWKKESEHAQIPFGSLQSGVFEKVELESNEFHVFDFSI